MIYVIHNLNIIMLYHLKRINYNLLITIIKQLIKNKKYIEFVINLTSQYILYYIIIIVLGVLL